VRIDYITLYDLPDRARWPRTQLGMCQAAAAIAAGLSDLGDDASYIGGLTASPWVKPLTRLKWMFYRQISRHDYYRWAEPAIVRGYGRQVSRRLRESPGDIALCLENALPIATVRSPKPLVLWTDAPLVSLVGLYPYMSNLCGETARNVRRFEAMALDRCALVCFSSEWAAAVARREYPHAADKIVAIPWGANLDRVPDRRSIERAIAGRSRDRVELLFLGKEWERKGGPLAVAVVAALRDRGVRVRLTIVGETPDVPPDLASAVRVLGYLDKADPNARRQLQRALRDSHFLLLPTRAETYGMVFCEAAAYGIPAIATRMGGIPTIVRDGESGRLFGLAAAADEYAIEIAAVWSEEARYRAMARAARREFEARLNWGSACEDLRERLAQL